MYKTIFWAFLFIPLIGFCHDLRLSVTNIDYDPDNQLFSLVMKVNAGDFVQVTGVSFDSLHGGGKDLQKLYRNKVVPWLDAGFTIAKGNKQARFQFVKFETDTEWVWLYLEFSLDTLADWTIRNSIFFDQYPEQVNLLVINYSDKQQGISFNPAEPEKTIRWTE